MCSYQLAQINIARVQADLDDPVMQGFVDRLDEINALADAAPGFIWRLQTDSGNATSIPLFDDPRLIINLSVWESIELLKQFVYRGSHTELIRARRQWFCRLDTAHQALWWVPAGHTPDFAEASARLKLIQRDGPSAQAFDFAHAYPASIGLSRSDA